MGWWNKFFGNSPKKETKEPLKEINFSELKKWLEEKREAKRKEVEKEAQPLIRDIHHTLEELRELTMELKNKDLPPEIPKRPRKIIKTSRPAFVEGLSKSLNLGKNLTLEELQVKLPESLNKIGKLLASKGRYLPLAFSDELEAIGKRANQLLREGEKLKSFSLRDKNLEQSLLQYAKIKQFQKELKKLAVSQEQIKQQLTKLHQEKKNLEEEAKEIEKSEKMKDFLQEQIWQKEIIQEKEKIEAELYNFLSPLKRSLKKFRRYLQVEGRGNKEIQGYLDEPVNQFLHTPEESLLNLLNEIKRTALQIKIKPRDLAKVEEAYNEFNELKKLKSRYFQIKTKEKEIQEALLSFNVVREREKMNQEIGSIQREINLKEEQLEKIKGQETEREEEIATLKSELQTRINNLSGKRRQINFLT